MCVDSKIERYSIEKWLDEWIFRWFIVKSFVDSEFEFIYEFKCQINLCNIRFSSFHDFKFFHWSIDCDCNVDNIMTKWMIWIFKDIWDLYFLNCDCNIFSKLFFVKWIYYPREEWIRVVLWILFEKSMKCLNWIRNIIGKE